MPRIDDVRRCGQGRRNTYPNASSRSPIPKLSKKAP